MDNINLILKTAVEALEEVKGEDIKVIKIDELTVLADYFIIATGNSTTQIKALADRVDQQLSLKGIEPYHREGFSSGSWILLDYNSVVIHIFHPETRDFYNLEKLWNDGEVINIDDIK
ncbi:MAG: ribosome silencing factor [Clostridia bacterium]|nr:ribosome silencing factor [Clostridia bacterium]